MASAPQLEIEKKEGVPVEEDGTTGKAAMDSKSTLKEQEEGAKLHPTTNENVTPGSNLLGHQDSAQPGIRPGDVAGKAGGTSSK
ncbi:unnamed protein product [Didymodactylos carnosus]|uniref:Uncharacterized protein n=1 Tax=Didymodactylos carnosus TaxID=1234261 RepID=A0A813UYV6_9BILA|nr:unnamed protein product [Didymodactylos carnosus]CAF0837151.1 unnamed protein product [Didymodactylos carnosus]CAF3562009.1 unnamed protein product [Didymodactylos carnosus]CAF3624207.1 unnamed protein product [Didymodactylos carnosus]